MNNLQNYDNNIFWLNDPKILFKNKYITEISFNNNMTLEQKLNALSRFIILVSIVGFVFIRHYSILLLGVIFLLIIIFYYSYLKEKNIEDFTLLSFLSNNKDKHVIPLNNPLMNPQTTDFGTPNKQNEGLNNEIYNEEINETTKQNILNLNENNKDNNKLFEDLETNMNFETSMRQFYTIPGSSNPNSQQDFLNYCYGNMPSNKNINVY